MKVLEITPHSWLVEQAQGSGLISEKNQGGYLIVQGNQAVEVNTKQELNEFFQSDVFGDISARDISTQSEYTVMGYPVNYPEPVVSEEECTHLPLFAKRNDTLVRLCAGYYALHSNMGWRLVFCPKLTTLKMYEYKGPYRTVDHAKKAIHNLRIRTDK